MGIIIDTSVLIAAERGLFDLDQWLAHEAQGEPLGLPTIVAAEFLHGVERAPAGKRRAQRLAFFEDFFARSQVLPFDIESARIHARVSAQLTLAGENIGPYDLIIAATRLRLDWGLATLNQGEFARVPNLRLVATEFD